MRRCKYCPTEFYPSHGNRVTCGECSGNSAIYRDVSRRKFFERKNKQTKV